MRDATMGLFFMNFLARHQSNHPRRVTRLARPASAMAHDDEQIIRIPVALRVHFD